MQKRKKNHMLLSDPAIPLDEVELFRWRDRLPPDEDADAWAKLAKQKKRDMNDIAAEGRDVFLEWWNDTSNMVRVSLPRSEDPDQESATSKSPIVNALKIITSYPEMKPPIIEGILRRGETMNIVAPPKVGKTWLILTIVFSIIKGLKLFDTFQCAKGRVLVIDNELHCETIGDRLKLVANSFDSLVEVVCPRIDYIPLRGELVDLLQLESLLKYVRRGEYQAIILDAFYKFFPKDTRENDNAMITALYNQIDYYAEILDTSFILVHHSSKGNQSEKGVTDVGAGGGSQARAADCHLVLREHQNDRTCIVDAEIRSWKRLESFCIKLDHPRWNIDRQADPKLFKGQKRPGDRKVGKGSGGQPETENAPTEQGNQSFQAIIDEMTTPIDAKSIGDIATRLGIRGCSQETLRKRLISDWVSRGLIRETQGKSGSIPAKYMRAISTPTPANTEQYNDNTNESFEPPEYDSDGGE